MLYHPAASPTGSLVLSPASAIFHPASHSRRFNSEKGVFAKAIRLLFVSETSTSFLEAKNGVILTCNQNATNLNWGASMRPRTEIPAVQVGAIRRAMLAAPNTSAFQRLQCLWLRGQRRLVHRSHRPDGRLEREPCVRRVWSGLSARCAVGRRAQGRLSTSRGSPPSKSDPGTGAVAAAAVARTGPDRAALVTARSLKLRYETRVGRAVARFDRVSAAGPAPVAAGSNPATQTSQRQPVGTGRF